MNIKKFFRIFRWLIAFVIVPLLVSCGGGGGCNATGFAFGSVAGDICKNNQSPVSTVISGMAAGGSPIIGNVEITDKFGVQKGSQIKDDGTYTVDVSGMTSPFIVKAIGTIAGVTVTYYSAGTQADFGSTINVTPFTDLLLSSIAGKFVSLYLADASNIPTFAATLTDAKIREAQDALFAKLRPVLIQLGVTETIDLIRTVFKADHSGLDALMDLVKVEYDTDTSVATLRNLITQDKMAAIDVTLPITSTPILPEYMGGISTSTTVDVQAIGEVLRRLENLFSSQLPTSKQVADSGVFDTSENFILGGTFFQQFADEISSDLDLVGASFTSWSLAQIDSSEATALVRIGYKARSEFAAYTERLVLRKIAGNWRISGNAHIASVEFKNEHELTLQVTNQLVNRTEPTIRNGIRFDVSSFAYNNSGKNNPRIESAEITGLGLPKPLLLTTNTYDDFMKISLPALTDGNGFWDCASAVLQAASLPCLDLPKVKLMQPYNIIFKDAQGQSLNGAGYKLPVDSVPKAFSELSTDMFISVTSININGSPVTSTSFGPNQTMRVDFTMPDGLQIDGAYIQAGGFNGDTIREYYSLPKGSTSAVFGWGDVMRNTTVSQIHIRVAGYMSHPG
jgi:hypothetical protein